MLFTLKEKVFGKNDIRGVYDDGITPELFYYVGKAYAKYIIDKNSILEAPKKELWVSVGMDVRVHSPKLADSLVEGLTECGINVLHLGLCPTPQGYFSEVAKIPNPRIAREEYLELEGTLIVTASHNPSQYNGLKMTYKCNSFSEANIKELKELTKKEMKNESSNGYRIGICKKYDIIQNYITSLHNSFAQVGKNIKIVVDSGNATGGLVAPELYESLGCEVIDIFTEPDGNFPNHHPNPSDIKTLKHLQAKVLEENADFGIAFDGDSDRVGIVDNNGEVIAGDKLLLIFAMDILEQFKIHNEDFTFISEVKCSQLLFDTINNNGGNAIMWKTGHGYIKSKMKEEKAVFAGEMSGHIFFKDRYYGFDDAFYAGCRFIEIVAKNRHKNPNFKVSDLIEAFPKLYTSQEVRFPCKDEIKQDVIAEFHQLLKDKPDLFNSKIEKIITLDGLRLVFNDGFALIRASNTEPVFTIRFEAGSEENLENYQTTFLDNLENIMKRFN